jgi:CBS domain-containing protein
VREARNDALHQGAFARHLTSHAIEIALVLEDALRSSERPLVSDYMVRNPVCAELWQPLGFIRQQMLASSFSFLPVLNERGEWGLVSDHALATFLGGEMGERKKRLVVTLLEAQRTEPTLLDIAEFVKEGTSIEEALKKMNNAPLLVCRHGEREHLLGIVTAFDLL